MYDYDEQEASLIMEQLYISEQLCKMSSDDPDYDKLRIRLAELDEIQSNLDWAKFCLI